MVATLVPGLTVEEGDTVTTSTLHSMIEDATIEGLDSSILTGGGALMEVSATPPDPDENKFWWDSRYVVGGVARVYAAPWNVWVTFGPDRMEVPFKNNSGQALEMGSMVIPDSAASAITIATGASMNVVGFLQNTCASGAIAVVASMGIGFVRWGTAVTNHAAGNTGELIRNRWNNAGEVNNSGQWNTADDAFGMFYGCLIEGNTGDRTTDSEGEDLVTTGYRALLWGPKTQRDVR